MHVRTERMQPGARLTMKSMKVTSCVDGGLGKQGLDGQGTLATVLATYNGTNMQTFVAHGIHLHSIML